MDLSLAGAVDRILFGYLAEEGFQTTSASSTQVELQRDDIMLRLSFYMEEALPHSLNVALGIRGADGSGDTVGLWAVMPPDHEAQAYALWRFASSQELEVILERLREEVLPAVAAPLWRNPGRLDAVLAREGKTRAEAHERRVDQEHLNSARTAFDQGEYRVAVDQYVLAGDRLTAADGKRLDMARRRLEASGS